MVTYLSGGVEMCVSQTVVVHLELEDAIYIGQLELNGIFTSFKMENSVSSRYI